MVARGIVPDLGLDLRKMPDLTDAATRKRLSAAAIEAFFRIVEKWELKNEDAMSLLRYSVLHGVRSDQSHAVLRILGGAN